MRTKSKLRAVLDSGPLIHLDEIGALSALSIFDAVFVAPGVREEIAPLLETVPAKVSKRLKFATLSGKDKDFSRVLSENYGIGLAEAEAIAVCKKEGIGLFLTDDLQARTTATSLGIEVHGTIGILLRAFRTGILPKETTISLVKSIPDQSSLFITSDLVEFVLAEIEKFKK